MQSCAIKLTASHDQMRQCAYFSGIAGKIASTFHFQLSTLPSCWLPSRLDSLSIDLFLFIRFVQWSAHSSLRFRFIDADVLVPCDIQSYGGGYGGSYGGGGGGGYGGGGGGGYGGGGGSYNDSGLGGSLRNIEWSSQTLTKFEKNFYREDPRVTARSDRETEAYRQKKEMKVS